MSIYRTLLSRGYFPKELPPAFYTGEFAEYAESEQGRRVLEGGQVPQLTNSTTFRFALPGTLAREMTIPHPHSFAALAKIVATNFPTLLTHAAASPFSRSTPRYDPTAKRALSPRFLHKNLARERLIARAGGAYVVKADISHFYPSIYTHAVGWAIDPELRRRENWHNDTFLGAQIDRALRNLQGRVSQGAPIGNDISYLLAEIVLGQVDSSLGVPANRAYRWYDDYEISCDSHDEADRVLAELTRELGKFRLRLNPRKTRIETLPSPASKEWQHELFFGQQYTVHYSRCGRFVLRRCLSAAERESRQCGIAICLR